MTELEQSADAFAHLADQQEARAKQAESDVYHLSHQHRKAEDELSLIMSMSKLGVSPTPVPAPTPGAVPVPAPIPGELFAGMSERGTCDHCLGEDMETVLVGDPEDEYEMLCAECVSRGEGDGLRGCKGECKRRLPPSDFPPHGTNGRLKTKCRQCLTEGLNKK